MLYSTDTTIVFCYGKLKRQGKKEVKQSLKQFYFKHTVFKQITLSLTNYLHYYLFQSYKFKKLEYNS